MIPPISVCAVSNFTSSKHHGSLRVSPALTDSYSGFTWHPPYPVSCILIYIKAKPSTHFNNVMVSETFEHQTIPVLLLFMISPRKAVASYLSVDLSDSVPGLANVSSLLLRPTVLSVPKWVRTRFQKYKWTSNRNMTWIYRPGISNWSQVDNPSSKGIFGYKIFCFYIGSRCMDQML